MSGAASHPAPRIRTRKEIHKQRRSGRHQCWNHIIVAPLWPKHGVNLGTLLRTCDAAGACLAVPRLPWVPEALRKGNTLRHRSCVHWIYGDVIRWLEKQRERSAHIVGVELTDESIRLAELPAARRRTVVVLGNEGSGIPSDAMELLDLAVEIPMLGSGHSLNVAVAGSLVLYKVAGLM
ncbi:TrmH family RNA methyltransferase [Mycolicibacterium fortuitum]|uniref:TrmH family RNA methyltransferase n=1 Tax=Mycolicibacterium fortuitum TaxID=1766 RepID=UPI001AEF7510|nr:TrmH family RNA methyltransferase [Mycolicibacterium fortuitum]MBP3085470.1 TrmH family RNA methyltransferase [Mycolicibacterium fortuitum]